MNTSRLLVGTVGVATLALLSACGTSTTPSTGERAAGDDGLHVITAAYPYQWLVEQVGGEEVRVDQLLQAGGDAHDLELSPQQMVEISQQADLVVYEHNLVPPVDAAVASGIQGTALDVGTLVSEKAGDDHAADEADHGDEEGTDTADEEHADPHVWLDPTLMVPIAEGIRDELSRIAPDSAETFAANTDQVVADLAALDEEFTAGLSQCEVKVFIPSHEAFGYLADRYGLEQVAVRGLDSSVEPSAARIAEVQDIARREGVTTIFYETSASPQVSEAIARDAGLRTDVLDSIEAPAADDSRGTDYPSRMRSNLESLRTANACR